MFGRKKKNANELEAQFPWSGDDAVPCNLALGHLRDNLLEQLKIEGKVHAESLISAIGCIAGLSAQCVVFDRLLMDGTPLEPPNFNVLTTKNGSKYYFSDYLNNELLFDVQKVMNGLAYWPLLAGGGLANGVKEADIPSYEPMFKYIAGQIGCVPFQLEVGRHGQPMLPPDELIKFVWPLALKCLDSSISEIATKFGPAPTKFWPVICGFVANHYIQILKDVLEPKTAITIGMESAILCSKLPTSILKEPIPKGT